MLLEVGEQVVNVGLLLETSEGHLVARDVLLGVADVLVKSALVPSDTLLLHGIGVGEAVLATTLATEDTLETGTDLVGVVDDVALSAPGLKQLSSLLSTGHFFLSFCVRSLKRRKELRADAVYTFSLCILLITCDPIRRQADRV